MVGEEDVWRGVFIWCLNYFVGRVTTSCSTGLNVCCRRQLFFFDETSPDLLGPSSSLSQIHAQASTVRPAACGFTTSPSIWLNWSSPTYPINSKSRLKKTLAGPLNAFAHKCKIWVKSHNSIPTKLHRIPIPIFCLQPQNSKFSTLTMNHLLWNFMVGNP